MRWLAQAIKVRVQVAHARRCSWMLIIHRSNNMLHVVASYAVTTRQALDSIGMHWLFLIISQAKGIKFRSMEQDPIQ